MEVKQIYNLINPWMGEVLGESKFDPGSDWVLQEDLSNITQVGNTLLSDSAITSAGEKWRDNYVRSMLDRIGRMVFVERDYVSAWPDLRRDEWEFGSIMTKSRCRRFKAKQNPSWALQSGQTVNQFEFVPPEVMTLFYNDKEAWQIECSFADVQLREAFTSPREMDRFLSMIESAVQRSYDAQIDLITSRTLNALAAEKLHSGHGVVDLLSLYNATVPQASQLTPQTAITNVDFLRFAAYQILLYKDRLKVATSWFIEASESGYDTQTPDSRLRFALHSDVAKAFSVYLQSETYHNEMTDIGSYTSVPCWQTSGSTDGAGGGSGFDFGATSRIDAKLSSDNTQTVNRTHIIGIMWDWDAAAICNTHRRVLSSFNSNGEYYTNYYKVDTMSVCDLMENAIVFVLGDGTVPTVTLSGTATAAVGSTSTLTATVTGAGDSPTVTWTSSDTSIATVSSGTVTGVAAGKAVITAAVTQDGTTYIDSKEFTVTAAPTENTKKK